MTGLADAIIGKAKSFQGIKAGFARLEDILKAPSYHAYSGREYPTGLTDNEKSITEWPPEAKSVLVLGLYHPEEEPQLDWCIRGNTMGNRRLMEISDSLKKWLKNEHGLRSLLLPYHVESGGLFLKDAAVLAGLGTIGRSNLLLNPDWGSRIRFRSILVEGDLEPTGPVEGFNPCESCKVLCHSACPIKAFSNGAFNKTICMEQINRDMADRKPIEKAAGERLSGSVIEYCRSCELACPVDSKELRS